MGDGLVNFAARLLLSGARLMPYERRVPFVGWVVSRLVAPLAGWDRRVRANLKHTCPDLPEAEIRRLIRAVPDNAGRTLIEIYSGQDFIDRVKDIPLTGPGVKILAEAHSAGMPAILVTGHFGNYDAPRAALIAKGYRLGALYRPMANPGFNAHYVAAISKIGTPVFPSERRGMGEFLRYLRSGAMAGILFDIYAESGAPVTFFGQIAPTAVSAAELALKYGAPMIPIFGVRKDNGLDFEIVVEMPIPASDLNTMTQAFNDRLEAQVRQNMGQWFWIHRRWKPERQRSLAAAKMGP